MIITILILTIFNFFMLLIAYLIIGYLVSQKLRTKKKVSTFSTPINHAYKKNSSRKL